MAYLRALDVKCDRCKVARALVTLFGSRNEDLGQFCRKCGAARLRERNASEASWNSPARPDPLRVRAAR